MNEKKFKDYRKKALSFYGKNRKKHVLKVEEISLMLCDIAGIKNKKERQMISLAALLHDISKGKHYNEKASHFLTLSIEHNDISADYVENCFFDNVWTKKRKLVAKIIRYHRGGEIYKTKFKRKEKVSIAIVRFADKIAKFYKCESENSDFEDALEKLNECIENLPKWLNP